MFVDKKVTYRVETTCCKPLASAMWAVKTLPEAVQLQVEIEASGEHTAMITEITSVVSEQVIRG